MTDLLVPKHSARERIAGFGKGGAGKSTAALQIANAVEGRMFVIDNDYAPSYEVLLDLEFPELLDRGTVEVAHIDPTEFAAVIDQIERWGKVATADDWLSLDSMTPTWQAVQGEYSASVLEKDIAEHFIEARKKQIADKKKVLGAFEGDTDWNVINRMYAQLYVAIAQWPGHVYLAADEKVVGDRDKDVDKDLYDSGFRPDGQKRFVNGHVTRTIVRFARYKQNPTRRIQMVKDRGREKIWDAETDGGMEIPFEDFAWDYLYAIAGWRPQK